MCLKLHVVLDRLAVQARSHVSFVARLETEESDYCRLQQRVCHFADVD